MLSCKIGEPDRPVGRVGNPPEVYINVDEYRDIMLQHHQTNPSLRYTFNSISILNQRMSSYAITGASKGIGREFVRQLAADSANTVLAIVRDPKSTDISDLASKYSNVHIIKGDVTDPKSILEAATAAAAITDGKLDVLIHNSNAVHGASMPFTPSQLPFDSQAIQEIFNPSLSTAIYGGLWATNAFLPLIEKGVQKKIVHISSGMADVELIKKTGISDAVAYSIAKAGMNVVVAKYATELAPRGIKVLALSPGWVDTSEGECLPCACLISTGMKNGKC